jgi:hypothetical protein
MKSNDNPEIPIGVQTTYGHLIILMKFKLLNIKDVRNISKYMETEKFSEKQFAELLKNHYWMLWNYHDSLITNYDQSVQLLGTNNPREIEKIKSISKSMLDDIEKVIQEYETILKVTPPSKYSQLKPAIIKVYENIFNPWKEYITKFEKLVKSPPKDDRQVDLVADFRPLHYSLMEFKSLYENVVLGNKQALGSSLDILDETVNVLDTVSSVASSCFIITAVYGTPFAHEIDVFRNYPS